MIEHFSRVPEIAESAKGDLEAANASSWIELPNLDEFIRLILSFFPSSKSVLKAPRLFHVARVSMGDRLWIISDRAKLDPTCRSPSTFCSTSLHGTVKDIRPLQH